MKDLLNKRDTCVGNYKKELKPLILEAIQTYKNTGSKAIIWIEDVATCKYDTVIPEYVGVHSKSDVDLTDFWYILDSIIKDK